MKKILIVDDDRALAELIAEFCQNAGFETRVITDSTLAFVTVLTWRPDLITLDLEMPGLDGVEVLRRLQGDPETRRIPVIVVSVVAKGALEQGFLKGARMVFEKPLRFQNLVSQLDHVIAASSAAPPNKPDFRPYARILSAVFAALLRASLQ